MAHPYLSVPSTPTRVSFPVGAGSSSARLAVVPLPAAPDPLVDTMPHPVVRLFPLPVAEPVAVPGAATSLDAADDAVYAYVDLEREAAATAELAATVDVREHRTAYHGRHSA